MNTSITVAGMMGLVLTPLQTLIQAIKESDDQETDGDDLNVLNILSLLSQRLLSQLMPLFSFSRISEHQE